jgi:membrane protein YqaA with SNARE-associated domain
MARLLIWTQTVLVPWLGAPGVLVVALLDSSFLSLPEITDLLVVTSAMRDAQTACIAGLMATVGSVAGCAALWWLGRRGGEGFFARRFGQARMARIRSAFGRWNLLALAVPAIMPPPVPFKAFVIAAGVFHVPFQRFAVTIFLARGLRYAIWIVVSLLFHERALDFLTAVDRWLVDRTHLGAVLGVGIVLLTGLLLLRRRIAAPEPADDVAV